MAKPSFGYRILKPFDRDDLTEDRILSFLRRLIALFGLLLLFATWKLWTPQTVFPQVPFLHWAGMLPGWCEWLGFGVMIVSLLAVLTQQSPGNGWRYGFMTFAFAAVGMILIDQHRFQPWLYQFVVLSLVLASVPARHALVLARLVVISLYFHSAVSKFDFSFFEINGQELLNGLLGVVNASAETWSPTMQRVAAGLFPAGELLVAVSLCIPRFRLFGLCLSLVMHILLFAALGPWGLNHKPGVLLWNLFFIGQNVLLFGNIFRRIREGEAAEPQPTISSEAQPGRSLVLPMVSLVVLLPFLEPFGRFDHWPAWSLYASRPERVQVWIPRTATEHLPESLRQHLGSARFSDDRRQLRIDRWSLHAVDAPIYPQNRFQIGVALALAQTFDLEDGILIVVETAADRFTGKRTSRALDGMTALKNQTAHYWLNSFPRNRLAANRR
jgi:hypothetical protein